MGTTAGGLRFPEPTDKVTDGATAIRTLAQDVDARKAALTGGSFTGRVSAPGFSSTESVLARSGLDTRQPGTTKPVADAPSTYPVGMSTWNVSTGSGWPVFGVLVNEQLIGSSFTVQTLYPANSTGSVWVRSRVSAQVDDWTAWRELRPLAGDECRAAAGSYIGDGTASRTITTPGRPVFVVVTDTANTVTGYSGPAGNGGNRGLSGSSSGVVWTSSTQSRPALAAGGFIVSGNATGTLNLSGQAYQYTALYI